MVVLPAGGRLVVGAAGVAGAKDVGGAEGADADVSGAEEVGSPGTIAGTGAEATAGGKR